MKKRVIVFLLICAVLHLHLIPDVCAAARNDILPENITLQTQVDYYLNEITVSGHVEAVSNNGLLCSFTIANEESLNINNAQNQVIAFEMTSTDAKGDFAKTISSPKVSAGGILTLKFNCENMPSAVMKKITVKSRDEINTLLEAAASAQKADLEMLICNNNDVYKFNLNYFELFSDKFTTNLFNGIRHDINKIKPISNFKALYNSCASLISIQNESGEKLIAAFKEYAGLIGINVTGDFETVQAAAAEVFRELAKDGPATIGEAKTLYNQSLAIAMVNNATRESMTKVLEDYNNILKLDLTGDYIDLGRLSVNQGLVNKNFRNIESIKDAFEEKIANLIESKGKKTGGGGGGRSDISAQPLPKITVTPTEKSDEETNYFSDLENAAWAKNAISDLYKKGIVSGYNDGTFLPNNMVTREEFLKMLMTALNIRVFEPQGFFKDVDDSSWYAPYVYGAFAKKIIKGTSQDIFGIGENIQRQDVAVMCHRILGDKGLFNGMKDFEDLQQVSDYAQESVKLCFGADILNGNEEGLFMPQNCLTRAEASQVIYNILSLIKGSEAR